jgi:hypothetical protein
MCIYTSTCTYVTFYAYQVAVKWVPIDTSLTPTSVSYIIGPGALFPPSQRTKSGTAKV